MDVLTRPFRKENEIKTASPVIDAEARTLYETKGFKEYTLRGIKKIMKAYKGLEEAQRTLLEALNAHAITIETQHAGTQYAKCSTALVEWGAFLGGLQKTFVESLDFSVTKPLELLTEKEIPEVLNQKKKFDNIAKDYQTILNTNANKRSKDDIDKAKGSYYKKGDEVHQLISDENDHLAVKTLEEQCYLLELYLQYFKGGYTYLNKLHTDLAGFRKFSTDEKQANASKSAHIKSGEWIPNSIAEKPTARVFNVPLREVVEREGSPSGVPILIEKAVQIVERKGLKQQGIFRISANKILLDTVQQKCDEGGVINYDEWDGHTAAGVIKAYLRSLPECLVTNELYNDFINTGDMLVEAQPARLKELIAKLPTPNYATLKCIMALCSKIIANEKENMMGPDNVATVLAPTVMFSKDDSLGNILDMIKRGNIVLSTMVKNYNELFEATWNKATVDVESPRGSGMLAGGPPKVGPPPVPKAPPKFAYPQPTQMKPVSNAIALEDDDEPKPPVVPQRNVRKRSLSAGDETEVNEWRAQNNMTPQQNNMTPQLRAHVKAPMPPKKPLYGVPLHDIGAKLSTPALAKSPKALPPGALNAPKTAVPKVGLITATQATQPEDNVSPLPVSPRGHTKVNSTGGTTTSAISPRGHTKVQSSGATSGAIQSPAVNAQQGPTVAPRPGLVRAATANPAGHAKVATGPPVVPQPIQSSIDSPKASSAPSNLSYLEYDLQAVIDLANQFTATTLQALTPNITLDDLNAINRLLKQVTQSTTQYISTIKQNVSKLPQHSNELTSFARALRDSVNIVIADFKIVCNNVSEDAQNLPAAIEKCVQSIDQLSRACYYNGALLTHLLQGDEFETVKTNISASISKLVTALRNRSKAVISECVYELASLASRLHAFANARGVEVPEVRAIIEPLQVFTKEIQFVCKQAAVIGEDDNVSPDTINTVIEKSNSVVKSLSTLKLPPPKQRYALEDQTLFLKKTREELARLTEFEEKFNSHRLVRMLITNLNKLASSLEVVQTKFNNDNLKSWIIDGFNVCGALLSIQNLINNTAKSCPDLTLKDILMQYKGMLQTNLFRMRIALFGQFHRDQSIAADPSLVELGTKCDEFEINLFTELKNFVYGARPFIFNFNEAITKIPE